jgi:alkylation response protein AidB-like acyl-CoA dehydrogenase
MADLVEQANQAPSRPADDVSTPEPGIGARTPGPAFRPPAGDLLEPARRARAVAAGIGPRAAGGPREWPREAIRVLGAHRLLAPTLGAEHGGAGVPVSAFVQIVEELTAVRTILGFQLESSSLIASLLTQFGDPEIRAEYLPRILTGEIASSHATTEPAGGSSMSSMRTTATRSGDDWIITGRKAMAALGEAASVFLVTARTEYGPTVFLAPADVPGITVGQRYQHSGLAELPVNPVTFDAVRVPARAIVGEPGGGTKIFVDELGRTGRTGQAAMFVGFGRAALESGYRFALRRRAGARPDPRDLRLAVHDRNLESARALTAAAAARADSEPGSAELIRLASAAKWLASDVAREVCLAVAELQGAWGMLPGRGLSELLADVLDLLPGGGSNDVMASSIVRSRLFTEQAGM